MKIIGKTPNGYILEASADEVAKVRGLYGEYKEEPDVRHHGHPVGTELPLSESYSTLSCLEGAGETIKELSEKMAKFSKTLADALPKIPKVEIKKTTPVRK